MVSGVHVEFCMPLTAKTMDKAFPGGGEEAGVVPAEVIGNCSGGTIRFSSPYRPHKILLLLIDTHGHALCHSHSIGIWLCILAIFTINGMKFRLFAGPGCVHRDDDAGCSNNSHIPCFATAKLT